MAISTVVNLPVDHFFNMLAQNYQILVVHELHVQFLTNNYSLQQCWLSNCIERLKTVSDNSFGRIEVPRNSLSGEIMTGEKKESDLATDYCTFTVAQVLVNLVINDSDVGIQFRVEEVALRLNLLPYSKSANFYMNIAALKHGLCLFKKEISNRGINTIELERNNRKNIHNLKVEEQLN